MAVRVAHMRTGEDQREDERDFFGRRVQERRSGMNASAAICKAAAIISMVRWEYPAG